jgi:hypothetical protein
MRVRVLNQKQAIRAIDRLEKRIATRQQMSDSLEKGAHPVEETAERLVPVDTGALRNDIQIGEDREGVAIFNTLDYAARIEFTVKSYLRAAAGNFVRSINIIARDIKRKI